MSDKELDDFFKEQSEQPDIPFVEEDWEKMKQKIGTSGSNGTTSAWHKRHWKWWGPLVVLLLVGGWIAWSHVDEGMDTVGTAITSANQKEIARNDDQTALANGDRQSNTPHKSVNTNSGEANGQMEYPREYPNNQRTGGSAGSHSGKGTGNKVLHQAVNGTVKRAPHFFVAERGEIPKEIVQPSPNEEATRESGQGKGDKQPAAFRNDQRWSVAGLLSPDISALKWKDLQGVGTSVGINLEYFIHPKWSVNLGFLYAFKTYQGEEDYSAFGSYYQGKVALEGNCFVFDVATDVRYYAFNRDLDRWYVSAGLSSYMMLREKYDLEYDAGNGYPEHKELDFKNKNSHPFSVINLSIGYERDLSEKLSLQVAPYYKVPWRGVGEGEVNLKSAGVLIGLKYNW